MPTIDIEVQSVTRKPGGVVQIEVETSDGARIERALYLDEVGTLEKLAAWLLHQDLEPPAHVATLEGAFRIQFSYAVDPETGGQYRVLDSVTSI